MVASTTAHGCEVANYVNVNNFTVICYERPSSITIWGAPGEPYVTFIMMNSVVDLVDGFFFRNIYDLAGRFKEVKAINNTWRAIRGEGLSTLKRAIRVDLSKNKIEEVQEKALVEMSQLKYLNLSGNIIESFYDKTFNMHTSVLEELDVSYNRLRKLGDELNELPELKILHLQYNYLTNISDEAFKNVKKLTYLNLQHNLLTSVGSSLQGLDSLVTLDLSYNYFLKLSTNDVIGLISIVNFNISHNELTSLEHNCFSEAKQLKTIDFSFNNVKMSIGEDMFVNNSELSYVNFYNNKIIGVRTNAFRNCDLHYLNLERNKIVGDLRKTLLIARSNKDLVIVQDKVDIKLELATTAKIERLQGEIQAIHSEIDKLKSLAINLSLSLKNHGDKINDLLKYIKTGAQNKQ